MLRFSILFFILAIVAAIFGWAPSEVVGRDVADAAKILFVLCANLYLVTLVAGLIRS